MGEEKKTRKRIKGVGHNGPPYGVGRICNSLWTSFCKRSSLESWCSSPGWTPGVVSSPSPAPRFLRRRLLLPSAEGWLPPTRFLLSRLHSRLKRAFSFFPSSDRMSRARRHGRLAAADSSAPASHLVAVPTPRRPHDGAHDSVDVHRGDGARQTCLRDL